MENVLSINEQITPINSSLDIVFTPNNKVTKYQYQLIQDDKIIKEETIAENIITTFSLTETGSYQIKLIIHEKNNIYRFDSGIYNIDKELPIISVSDRQIDMLMGSAIDIMAGVSAIDTQDGDIKDRIKTNYDQLDFTTIGLKELQYSVMDQAGNKATTVVNINVMTNNNTLLFFQGAILFSLLLIVIFIIFFKRSFSLERRIAKYAIEPLDDKSTSLFDNLVSIYQLVLSKFLKVIDKSVFINKYAKKYDKYVNIINKRNVSGLELVANKFLLAIIFVLIAIIAKTLHYKVLTLYEIIFPLLIGFFVLDIVYIYKYRRHRKQLENDLLQAIIIMNNAFKSGRSISQSIELVAHELEGPIAEEFKKMHLELTFGLAIDVIFKRFSERIKLDEITYLTASLTILNKTGGNIIKVFTSIEKTLFNKKKLKLELASLTGSSKIIAYVLFVLPFLFALFIMLIDPTYFVVLYTTTLGYILLTFIIIIYITYIFFVRKIMKVRM